MLVLVLCLVLTQIVTWETFFTSYWPIGIFAWLFFVFICVVFMIYSKIKSKNRLVIVCYILILIQLYFGINLASRRTILITDAQYKSVSDNICFGSYGCIVVEDNLSGDRYRLLCKSNQLCGIGSKNDSVSYEVRLLYSYFPPHFGVLYSIRESPIYTN